MSSIRNWETLSNLAFIAVGIYMLTLPSVFWGWSVGVVCMGVGSMYGHATGRYRLDWLGMYLAYTMQLAHYAARPLLQMALLAVFVLLWLNYDSLRAFKVHGPNGLFIAMGLLYTATLIWSFWASAWWLAALSGLTYALALYVRQKIDHGLWHVLVAVGIALLTVEVG